MRRVLIGVAVIVFAGCAAVGKQKAQAPKPDNLQFKNLQVLTPNITHDELIATMRTYARSLGTRCEHCHVQIGEEPNDRMDFVSDAKPEKKAAREMMRMVAMVNADYMARVNVHGQKVTCATCHRGHTVPEQWTPPAPPERHPAGTATPSTPAVPPPATAPAG